ncbi:hypothetical protein B0T22DRAFT_443783 [Podospora appendiculata]|uniref:Uncharacterized protein n=1 Tax=Podospora appendiculata TaxID=314037 RepID=A0AAE0X2Z5_9PEZI|nr:hypothetical protein B0T22DRAFT_443783 [Podospora appendiculata]
MAASTIPRFLLPQYGLMWRRVPSTAAAAAATPSHAIAKAVTRSTSFARFASKSASPPGGPRILEKPERFNPPSHGARLPKKVAPRHYGGDLSAAEVQAQKRKDYPGLQPPPGTFGHWFMTRRWIHAVVTMGTLGALAFYTARENFRRNSPFADMVPSAGDFVRHPIESTRAFADVIRLNEMHNAAIVQAKRQKRIDDVAKRTEYRKAHGLPLEQGFFGKSNNNTTEAEAAASGPAAPSGSREERVLEEPKY